MKKQKGQSIARGCVLLGIMFSFILLFSYVFEESYINFFEQVIERSKLIQSSR
jgi:hypothetical protein